MATAAAPPSTDYAFEMAASTIRFGPGVTREVGMDAVNLKAKRVMVLTDKNIAAIPGGPLDTVLAALSKEKGAIDQVSVFDEVQVEPTDASFAAAIAAAQAFAPDLYIAVGGGSVMDTAKAANLYDSHRGRDFLDFVNAPIGKGLPVPGPVKPLIAVPTTAGTGSETTGVAIFDMPSVGAKTGIASRLLKPTLGLVDPNNTLSMPPEVAAASGFDVLGHALESYTAVPFYNRGPRPANPALRPTYQGSNPISDLWSMHALRLLGKHFIASVKDRSDEEANAAVTLAATIAGIGFGNAGVHLCHGMSYAISGNNKAYYHPAYPHAQHPPPPGGPLPPPAVRARTEFRAKPKPLVPHGVSVIMSAPAVFAFTAGTNPGRHVHAARILAGDDTAPAMPPSEKPDFSGRQDAAAAQDAGARLADQLRRYMQIMRVPDGLQELGYGESDVPSLVAATLPQKRVLDLAPKHSGQEELSSLFKACMKVY
jgi:hydroxyacid-oxoacid transhydrogenase